MKYLFFFICLFSFCFIVDAKSSYKNTCDGEFDYNDFKIIDKYESEEYKERDGYEIKEVTKKNYYDMSYVEFFNFYNLNSSENLIIDNIKAINTKENREVKIGMYTCYDCVIDNTNSFENKYELKKITNLILRLKERMPTENVKIIVYFRNPDNKKIDMSFGSVYKHHSFYKTFDSLKNTMELTPDSNYNNEYYETKAYEYTLKQYKCYEEEEVNNELIFNKDKVYKSEDELIKKISFKKTSVNKRNKIITKNKTKTKKSELDNEIIFKDLSHNQYYIYTTVVKKYIKKQSKFLKILRNMSNEIFN